MAFQSNPLQNIIVCNKCGGYGVLNPDDPIANHKDCPECTNDGVYIKRGNETYIFGMPTFVNYQSRRKHQILLIGFILICILLLATILVKIFL